MDLNSPLIFFNREGIYNAVTSAKGREGSWSQTNLNKKFWEVQEPFFKRVLGRRRHRLAVELGGVMEP